MTPAWSWLGTPPDLRAGGAMGIALAVLLEPAVPCTVSAKEALCPKDITFEEFLERLRIAGYRPESKAMQAALADQGRWLSQTVRRSLDRAASVEIAQASSESASPESASTRKAVNTVIGGGETFSRAAERSGTSLFRSIPRPFLSTRWPTGRTSPSSSPTRCPTGWRSTWWEEASP